MIQQKVALLQRQEIGNILPVKKYIQVCQFSLRFLLCFSVQYGKNPLDGDIHPFICQCATLPLLWTQFWDLKARGQDFLRNNLSIKEEIKQGSLWIQNAYEGPTLLATRLSLLQGSNRCEGILLKARTMIFLEVDRRHQGTNIRFHENPSKNSDKCCCCLESVSWVCVLSLPSLLPRQRGCGHAGCSLPEWVQGRAWRRFRHLEVI